MTTITSFIHTPTPNLELSRAFYNQLNFKELSAENPTLFTDGTMLFEVNPDRYARAGIKCFKTDWSAEVAAFQKFTEVIKMKNGFVCSDPNGVWVYLINSEIPDYNISGSSISTLGNCAGLSIEATDLNRTADFWKTLGYKITMGSPEQGWIGFSNGSGVDLSVMKAMACPHLFFNPSLSYFNGKNNLEVIQKIRDAGIPITEEITHFNKEGIVDNMILRDPGGFGFFIFNDG